MIKELSEIAPVSAVLAVAVWGGISYFVTGPEAATRIAHADYIESCEANLVSAINATSREQEQAFNQSTNLENEAARASSYWNGMQSQYGEHTQLLDMLSGGGFSQTINVQNEAARQARQARANAQAAIRARARRAAESAPDQCSCQIQAALGDSRSEWAMYVATLTLVEQ